MHIKKRKSLQDRSLQYLDTVLATSKVATSTTKKAVLLDGITLWSRCIVYGYRLARALTYLVTRTSHLERLTHHLVALQDLQEDRTLKQDRGLLSQEAKILHLLDLDLALATVCYQEYHDLLHGGTPKEAALRIYHITHREPTSPRNETRKRAFTFALAVIECVHREVTDTLSLAREPVSWQLHSNRFKAIAKSLQLVPEKTVTVERGKHWQRLGFQGEDPSSDFRGTGLLGLLQLESFCDRHPLYARRIIVESGTTAEMPDLEQPWYSFALAGIHCTRLLTMLLEENLLHRQSLEAGLRGDFTGATNGLYSWILVRSHVDWLESIESGHVRTVLDFERNFAGFAAFVRRQLREREYAIDDFYPIKWW